MSVKQFRARVQHKHKTEAEWYLDVYVSAGSADLRDDPFIPLDGELVIFEKDDTHEKDRFKFGDGETNVMDLPFASTEQAQVQIQADWNQTDDTKADFIKNRTHYTTGSYSHSITDPSSEMIASFLDSDGYFLPGEYDITDDAVISTTPAIVKVGEKTRELTISVVYDDYDEDNPGYIVDYVITPQNVTPDGPMGASWVLTFVGENVKQLDAKYIPIDHETITIDDDGKIKANLLAYKETTTTETINVTKPTEVLNTPSISYGNDRLVCIDYERGVGSKAYYSDDKGQTWQSGTFGYNEATCAKLVFGNGVFVGMTDESEDCIYYSEDGINWDSLTITANLWEIYEDIAFGDGKFIAVYDMGSMQSTDGVTWSSFEAYGNCVAIGNGRVVTTDRINMYSVYSLDDGSLISSDLISSMYTINGIEFINNQFVCYGNTITVSSDGENWRSHIIDDDRVTNINQIVYVNDTYVAYSDGGELISHDNGTTWTSTSVNFARDRDFTCYKVTDNLLLATNDSSLIASNDGINWGTSANIIIPIKCLEQGGIDVTSQVATLIGGNSGAVDEIRAMVTQLIERIAELEDTINSITTLDITKDDNGQLTITE